jgi:hypothetical protein
MDCAPAKLGHWISTYYTIEPPLRPTRIDMDQGSWFDGPRGLFVVVTLGSLGCVAGCAAVNAVSVSSVALAGQVIAGRGQDITANDVYQGEALWQDYRRGATYELKHDVFYGKAYVNPLDLDDLIRPGYGLNTIPTTVEAYVADPARWPAIKGVISAGSRLHVGRVLYIADLNLHDFYYIGVIDTGPSAGREVLLNQLAFAKRSLGKPRDYDPRLLEPLNLR